MPRKQPLLLGHFPLLLGQDIVVQILSFMSSYRKTPATGYYLPPSSITKTGKQSYKHTICRCNLIIYEHMMDTVTVGSNFGLVEMAH